MKRCNFCGREGSRMDVHLDRFDGRHDGWKCACDDVERSWCSRSMREYAGGAR